jgi:hypothetical protein
VRIAYGAVLPFAERGFAGSVWDFWTLTEYVTSLYRDCDIAHLNSRW